MLPHLPYRFPCFCPLRQKQSGKSCLVNTIFYTCWQLKSLNSWQFPQYAPLTHPTYFKFSQRGGAGGGKEQFPEFVMQSVAWLQVFVCVVLSQAPSHTFPPAQPLAKPSLRYPTSGKPSLTSLPHIILIVCREPAYFTCLIFYYICLFTCLSPLSDCDYQRQESFFLMQFLAL